MLLTIFLFSCSLIANAGGIYPDFLYGDQNYQLIGARMGSATYINKTSATRVLRTESDGIVAATFVAYNVEKNEQGKPFTVFFYVNNNPNQRTYKKMHVNGYDMTLPPYAENSYYTSYDNGVTWSKRPFSPKVGPDARVLAQFKSVLRALQSK